MSEKKEKSYSHFIDGKGALTKEPLFITKDRAFLYPLTVALMTPIIYMSDIPYSVGWLSKLSSNSYQLNTPEIIVTVCILAGIFMLYLRARAKRSLEVKSLLHSISHQIRNHFSHMYQSDNESKIFSKYSKEIVGQLSDYFNELIKNKDIKVAVRILTGSGKELGYETVARSSKLSISRGMNSQKVPVDKGEAKLLTEYGCKGVIIYNNLDDSEDKEFLFKTQNRKDHRSEVECLMVAPINAWNGKKVDMIGMLYIVSSKKNSFREKHTDIALFTADMLATLYTGVIHCSSEN